jgi:hypothetical protein
MKNIMNLHFFGISRASSDVDAVSLNAIVIGLGIGESSPLRRCGDRVDSDMTSKMEVGWAVISTVLSDGRCVDGRFDSGGNDGVSELIYVGEMLGYPEVCCTGFKQ